MGLTRMTMVRDKRKIPPINLESGLMGNQGEGLRGMGTRDFAFWVCVTMVFCSIGCSQSTQVTEIKRFPVDDLHGIITQSGVQIDRDVSSDGRGSLRTTATEPMVVRLFELGDIDVEDASLIYQAKVRTKDVTGQVFLEMWCHFPGRGRFLSRGLQTSVSGTTDWTTGETPLFLRKGRNPSKVKLNLVIKGKGTAWIDDVRLLKRPL